MSEITAVVVCCGTTIVSIGMLIWAWALSNAAGDAQGRIDRSLREVSDARDTIKSYAQAIRNAADIIERVANPPAPPKKAKP